jgi:hypothetical protein
LATWVDSAMRAQLEKRRERSLTNPHAWEPWPQPKLAGTRPPLFSS